MPAPKNEALVDDMVQGVDFDIKWTFELGKKDIKSGTDGS
jgi:hypothetical protein